MTKRGFSLLELLIGLAIGAVSLGVMMQASSHYLQSDGTPARAIDDTSTLLEATRVIQELGRVSRACTRTVIGANTVLICQTAITRPFDGTFTWVRFLLNAGALEYQRDDSGTGSFTPFAVVKRYPGIENLEVCGDTELSGGTCPILPLEFNARYAALGIPGHFFRVRLSRTLKAAAGDTRTVAHQTAFYVRNGAYSNGVFYR